MLGSFLELGVAAPQIEQSFAFYQRLGFGSAITNDIWNTPYGVMVSGALALGLHAHLDPSPALTFVKPDVAALALQLERRGIDITTRRLGAEHFNEIGFEDAAGLAVRVLEARTFSPPREVPQSGALGRFDGVSFPARDPETAIEFWRALDYLVWEPDDEDWPWRSVSLGALRLAFHRRALCAEPLLVFGAAPPGAFARPADIGLAPRTTGVRLPGSAQSVFEAPEGTLLMLRDVTPL